MAAMLTPRPRNLTDVSYMSGRSDQQLFEVISQGGAAVGLSAAMTAFGTQLTPQQIWDTVTYVRTLAQATPTAPGPSSPPAAAAQTPATGVTISRLRLSIWPEYDDPRVLIILRGELIPRQAFPGTITLPIPQGAEIIGAGIISEQNELLVHPYNVVAGEPLDSIQLNLPTPRFFMEFYYTPWPTNTADKRFTYSTPSTYPIEVLEVDIQQPLQATHFSIDPTAMERRTDTQKFTYHQYVYRDIPAGQPRTFQLAYTKTSPTPSVPKQPGPSARASTATTRTRLALVSFSILAGAVVIFAGWVWLLCSHRAPQHTATVPQPPPRSLEDTLALLLQDDAAAPVSSASSETPQASRSRQFCTQCGHHIRSEDHYCAACGKPIIR